MAIALNCQPAKQVAIEDSVIRDAIEIRYGEEKTTAMLSRRLFAGVSARGTPSARCAPPFSRQRIPTITAQPRRAIAIARRRLSVPKPFALASFSARRPETIQPLMPPAPTSPKIRLASRVVSR